MRITRILKNKEIETVQEEENSVFGIFGSKGIIVPLKQERMLWKKIPGHLKYKIGLEI